MAINFYHDDRTTTCVITYNNLTFTGVANRNPEDAERRFTGETLAEMRARIKYVQFIRDYELKPRYDALHQLYYSIKHSKNYSEHSYEARAIRRQMYQAKQDYDYACLDIKETKKGIYEYIEHLKKV